MLQIVQERDKSFVCHLADERKRLSDDDFVDLLSKHLSDTDCLRHLQNAEKHRLNDKMKAKLKEHENNSFHENVSVFIYTGNDKLLILCVGSWIGL